MRARSSCARRAGPSGPTGSLERGIVALTGVDTRSLVLRLRDAGAMRAVAVSGESTVEEALATARSLGGMRGRALVDGVSTKEPYIFSDAGTARVAVVDYGCKRSILRRLARAGAAVTVYPHDVDADELAGYDGVLLSNGPGDPEPLEAEMRGRARARRPRAGARDLPRPPAARPCDRLRRPRSCRSATAARTIRCSSARADACS